jgi:hypothetical protein
LTLPVACLPPAPDDLEVLVESVVGQGPVCCLNVLMTMEKVINLNLVVSVFRALEWLLGALSSL